MPQPTPPNLGVVVPSGRARQIIYGAYAVGALAVGGAAAYFLGTGDPLPDPVLGAQAVVAYLGIPIGALAAANTTS
jgi:hypothetical protein